MMSDCKRYIWQSNTKEDLWLTFSPGDDFERWGDRFKKLAGIGDDRLLANEPLNRNNFLDETVTIIP